jgi:hypothetical protein
MKSFFFYFSLSFFALIGVSSYITISYLPSFYEGGSSSVAPLSSVSRDLSPSEFQVFISKEKPEIISDSFASH